MATRIIVKKDKEDKIRNFYPNVYMDEIKTIMGKVENGQVVEVCAEDLSYIATGYIAENTNAFVRVLTTKNEVIDKNFFIEKIKRAYAKEKYLKMKLIA